METQTYDLCLSTLFNALGVVWLAFPLSRIVFIKSTYQTTKGLLHFHKYNWALKHGESTRDFVDTSILLQCDHDCRTRNGKNQRALDGFKRTISSGPGFRNSYNEKIISNANCLKLINSHGGNTIKTIKRCIVFLSLMTFDIK